MERVDRPSVATFLAPGPLVAGGAVRLGEDVAHHMRVRRLAEGERIALLDGAGSVAAATLRQLAKRYADAEVTGVERRARPPAVRLLVPVADRDRTLWLAEKATELGLERWQPVVWRRSRSVSSKGEGTAFEAKVRARMAAALVQCEGAWLPSLAPPITLDDIVLADGPGPRLLLDADGEPLSRLRLAPPVTIALGPEGGVERDERDRLVAAGFRPAALPGNILRFETAGVVALALTLAALYTPGGA